VVLIDNKKARGGLISLYSGGGYTELSTSTIGAIVWKSEGGLYELGVCVYRGSVICVYDDKVGVSVWVYM